MKKEAFFAIIAGTVIGLIVAFGLWKLTASLKRTPDSPDNTPKETVKPAFLITLSKPLDATITTSKDIEVAGVTQSSSKIIFSTIDFDYEVKSDEKGEFLTKFDVLPGLSKVNYFAVSPKGEISKGFFEILYSKEFEKYEEGQDDKKPTYYKGVVTDISEGAVQIKSEGQEILQLSVNGNTSYVKSKSEELAIGDTIIAMGYVNGNNVLATKRILVGDELQENNTDVVFGNVANSSAKKLTITSLGDDITLDLPKKWFGPDIDELEDGVYYIFVYQKDDDTSILRSIFTGN